MKLMKNLLKKTRCVLLLSVAASSSFATPVSTLREAVSEAVSNSPDVMASWYGLRAAVEEQRVARGGYYPSLDLNAEIGREKTDTPTSSSDAYHPDSSRLTLTQMLFDGFETKNEVARLGFEKLASYYDFKQVSEEIALEVFQAYLDVLRYRELVELAKENYIQHRLIFDDIEERVTSGLGRRVDLEQASGRLALSESNLLTERTNLHDVTLRFHRLVGLPPARQLESPALLSDVVPESQLETLERAFYHSPQLSAAIERIRATRAELKRKNSAMMPRFDLRLRQEIDHDTDGEEGLYEEQAAELVMTYNLYNGGSDSASKRQTFELLNRAKSLRDKACRDIRQKVLIAQNDIQSQTQQVEYLNRNQIAIGKARTAYRKQFDIGQRTLLDLLDTENEYFETRRALVGANADLTVSKARTLEAMGQLLSALSLSGLASADIEESMLQKTEELALMKGRCSLDIPVSEPLDNEALLSELYEDPRFRKLQDGKASFQLDVKFDFNSSIIPEGEQKDLSDAANFLKKHSSIVGVIEGHTDAIGSAPFNLSLSERRAEAVKQYLVSVLGVADNRLQSVGYGESKPLVENESSAGRQQNRRVELVMEIESSARKPRLSDFTNLNGYGDESKLETSRSLHKGWTY